MTRLNPRWKAEQVEKIGAAREAHSTYEITTGIPVVKKWVILELDRRGMPFKVYNLGAGVARVTTDTDTCPCCKKKL